MSTRIEEFRTWFEDQQPADLVTWIREGVGRWVRDENLRRAAFSPAILQPDLPLSAQLCNDVRVAAGVCPSRFSAAVDKVLAMWSAYEPPEAFGEYALMAGRMSSPGLAAFLTHLTPANPAFRAAGVNRRRSIISNCAEAVEWHSQFDFPEEMDAASENNPPVDRRLYDEIRRLRRDFHKPHLPDVQREWLPREGVRLIDRLATKRPVRIFDAFSAFREDFESYFRDAPQTAYRILQRLLRETNPGEVAQALSSAGPDADWLLPYLFGTPAAPTMEGGEPLIWPRLLAAEWVSQNGEIQFRYDDGVYQRLPQLGGVYAEFSLAEPKLKGTTKKGAVGPLTGERRYIFESLIGPVPSVPKSEGDRTVVPFKRNAFES